MADPSAGDVDRFLDFASAISGPIPRSTAITFLKGNANDVNQAFGAFMEDANPKRYESSIQWDESSWGYDRYGPATQIESEPPFGDLHPNDGTLGPILAPSRPPSRVNYRGVQQSEAIEVSKEENDASSNQNPGNDQRPQYDEEIAEAMKRSLDPGEQVTGVIDPSGKEHMDNSRFDPFSRFVNAWQAARIELLTDHGIDPLSYSKAVPDLARLGKEVHQLHIPLSESHVVAEPTLYDALDDSIWSQGDEERVFLDDWLEAPSSIIFVRLNRRNVASPSSKPLRIPGTLNISRYLRNNFEKAEAVKAQKAHYVEAIQNVDNNLQRIENFRDSSSTTSTPRDGSKLLRITMSYLEKATTWVEHGSESQNAPPFGRPIAGDFKQTLDQLKQIHDTIQNKTNSLKKEIAELQAKLGEISNAVTEADYDSTRDQTCHFPIKGVATLDSDFSTTVYTRHVKTADDLAEIDDDMSLQNGWWKLNFHSAAGVTIQGKEVVTEDQVLEATERIHSELLLLYARHSESERTVQVEDGMLEDPKEQNQNRLGESKLEVLHGQPIETLQSPQTENAAGQDTGLIKEMEQRPGSHLPTPNSPNHTD